MVRWFKFPIRTISTISPCFRAAPWPHPPHVMGRGFAVKALRQFIAYVKDIDGVWFPKREEISDWYAENHASHIAPRDIAPD